MKHWPKITIVTPVFNGAEEIRKTMESIFIQEYPNLEYFVYDGGSTDGTVEVLQEFSDKITAWQSGSDEGHYDAVNKAFEQATGEIFAWLNAGDLYFPWALRHVAKVFTHFTQVHWLSTGLVGETNQDLSFGRDQVFKGISKESFCGGFHTPGSPHFFRAVQQESTFWRKSLWDEKGGINFREYPLAGDFALWCQFFEKENLYLTTSSLGVFRKHSDQKSQDIARYYAQATAALENHDMKPLKDTSWAKKFFSKKNRIKEFPLKVIVVPGLSSNEEMWEIQETTFEIVL